MVKDTCTAADLKSLQVGKWEIFSEVLRQQYFSSLVVSIPGKEEREIKAKSIGVGIASKTANAQVGHGAKATPRGGKSAAPTSNAVGPDDIHRAKTFDSRIVSKLGACYSSIFSRAIENMMRNGMDYNTIKEEVKIPAVRGAKIAIDAFAPFAKK